MKLEEVPNGFALTWTMPGATPPVAMTVARLGGRTRSVGERGRSRKPKGESWPPLRPVSPDAI